MAPSWTAEKRCAGPREYTGAASFDTTVLHCTDLQVGDWTPLNHAARNGRLECVRLLLEKGADTEAKEKVRVPLMSC